MGCKGPGVQVVVVVVQALHVVKGGGPGSLRDTPATPCEEGLPVTKGDLE